MEGVDKWMSFFDIRAEVFRNGVRNKRRASWVHVLAPAILATLIAMSTLATQTCHAIVVPLPSLVKSTSMRCLCRSCRESFFVFRRQCILAVNS